MSCGLILFSRFDSRRLPGKALIDIGGRPLLGRVIDRARRVKGADCIILATSDRGVDDVLADYARAEGIGCFRGDTDDVAGRARACAQAFGLDRFARICGDRVFFDPVLVGALLARHQQGDAQVVTTAFPSSYPPGLTTEVIAVAALADAVARMTDAAEREHLTAFFYKHPELYKIHNVAAPAGLDFTGVRLVVDDAEDLERARWMVAALGHDPAQADLETVISLARDWHRLHRG